MGPLEHLGGEIEVRVVLAAVVIIIKWIQRLEALDLEDADLHGLEGQLAALGGLLHELLHLGVRARLGVPAEDVDELFGVDGAAGLRVEAEHQRGEVLGREPHRQLFRHRPELVLPPPAVSSRRGGRGAAGRSLPG